ncbi:MAG: ATP-binding protein [Myxococcaceae bacterium]|nr:MAG: ATP-binding protein [Myxococcaceae bacterium]
MADEQQPSVDLLILTSKQSDYDGVELSFNDVEVRDHPTGRLWRHATWTSRDGRPLSIAIAMVLPGDTQKFTWMVQQVRPRLIVHVGVAIRASWASSDDVRVVTRVVETDPRPGADESVSLPIQDGQPFEALRLALAEFASTAPWALGEPLRASCGDLLVSSKAAPSEDELTMWGINVCDRSYGLEDLLRESHSAPLIVVRGVVRRAFDPPFVRHARKAAVRFATEFAVHFRDKLRLSPPTRPSLPPHPPASVSASPHANDLFREAVVSEVSIRGFKSIVDLTVDLSRNPESEGHWTCLAGVNGAGKSATQQALVLALLGPRYAPELGGAWLRRMRRTDGSSTSDAVLRASLREDSDDTHLTLPITDNGIDLGTLSKKESISLPGLWDLRARNQLLLAYGPGRNLSEHDDNRHRNKSREVQRVMTLFDPLTQVTGAEAFLRGRMLAPAVKLAHQLLATVLDGMPITVTSSDAALQFKMGDALLDPVDLPDGFRATIAWIVDLCAAWSEFDVKAAATGDLSRLRALVVIDEIDLHLHPRLQRELVPRLRKLLPRVQWIVSTHSPLVLASFDRREIVMLENDEHGRVRQREVDRQVSGLTIDEVYRWLMETEPRSVALLEKAAAADESPEAAREYALLLGQSPEHSEDDVRRAYAARAERLRQRQAAGIRESTSRPTRDDGEPET